MSRAVRLTPRTPGIGDIGHQWRRCSWGSSVSDQTGQGVAIPEQLRKVRGAPTRVTVPVILS
jgi:hypothetical protein